MPKKYKERSLIEFQKEFPDNEACAKHLVEQRWPKVIVCPRHENNEVCYLSKRQLFDCKMCRFQTSVTAGKIFHGTYTPLVTWYLILCHMAMGKVWVSVA